MCDKLLREWLVYVCRIGLLCKTIAHNSFNDLFFQKQCDRLTPDFTFGSFLLFFSTSRTKRKERLDSSLVRGWQANDTNSNRIYVKDVAYHDSVQCRLAMTRFDTE